MRVSQWIQSIFRPTEPFFKVYPKVWLLVFVVLVGADLLSKKVVTENLNFHLAYHQIQNVELNRSLKALYDGTDFIPLLGEEGALAKFRLVFNDRFIFGIGPSAPVLGFFSTLTAIFILFLFRWHNAALGHPIAWLLVFSGATGNLVDKMFIKSVATREWIFTIIPQKDHVSGVVDFIEVIWFGLDQFKGVWGLNFLSWDTWPSFNVADSFIVVGITLLVFTMKEYGGVSDADEGGALDGKNQHSL